MIKKRNPPPKSLPVANYRSAIARSVAWLGDRYLLAKPIHSGHARIAGNRAPTFSPRPSRDGAL